MREREAREGERDNLKKEEQEKMEEIAIHSYRARLIES